MLLIVQASSCSKGSRIIQKNQNVLIQSLPETYHLRWQIKLQIPYPCPPSSGILCSHQNASLPTPHLPLSQPWLTWACYPHPSPMHLFLIHFHSFKQHQELYVMSTICTSVNKTVGNPLEWIENKDKRYKMLDDDTSMEKIKHWRRIRTVTCLL